MVPFEKFRMVYFYSSIMRNIVALSSRRFPVKLTCFIDFGPASSFCCLLKSTAVNLYYFSKQE